MKLQTSKITSIAEQRVVKLTSVRNLRRLIEEREHLGVKSIVGEHKFVGCVNRALALMQHLTQLYLVNIQRVSQELFYQIIIYQFGNFGYLELSEPAPLAELVRLVLDTPESGWEPDDGDKDELAKYTSDLLLSKADMLMDYFSIEINGSGELTAIPILLDNYVPDWNKLPMLLLRLASEVCIILDFFMFAFLANRRCFYQAYTDIILYTQQLTFCQPFKIYDFTILNCLCLTFIFLC